MSYLLRRFEILLPLRFNDGRPVPDELVGETLLELRQQFNAISAETRVIRGHWQHDGEDRAFFVTYKERLKARSRQIDIGMKTHPIEVI